MSWKQSLDKWLTTEPELDGYNFWCDDLIGNHISEDFYEKHESWLNDFSGVANKWMNKLFYKDIRTKPAAQIIERAFYFYKLNTQNG